MELNPYANYLGTRDPIAVLESTYADIARLTAEMPKEQFALRRPEGRWNAREIVCHMADCETVYNFRLKQALAEDNPVQQPWDQNRWAARYTNTDFDSALRLWQAARQWTLLLITSLTAAERERPTHHPERGAMVLWTIVETIAGHDINHLGQLERLLGTYRAE